MKALWSIAVLSGLLAAPPAIAQGTYPDRTIRIFVGFPAGGPPDIAARLLAERFSASWGKSVVVENATGSGGNIAVERAVKSTPDGYTLLMASNAIAINPSLYPSLPYNAMQDLVPISLAVIMPVILVVNNDVPAKSAREFAALARTQPGNVIVGQAGVGTPAHLAGELFKSVNGIDVQQVAYRGIPALLPDLLAGRISAAFPNISVVLQLVQDGKLRALAVTSRRRATAMPDVPTMSEAGLPAIDADAWFGLMAPVGTPAPNRRAAASRIRAYPGTGRRAQAPGRSRNVGGGELTRGIRRAHQIRYRAMGEDDQGRGDQGC